MRRLILGILIVVGLVAVVTGCGGVHRYDARLVAADSLMQAAPDSALAIVEALPADSLPDEGDRAYRDLLLTQARYRNYIVATSDSDINRALGYYRAHAREREKLTRAYIYKGAVMEELGHPDSAMFYYKHAEATADEKDYANLGYCSLRIADLYRRYYGDKEICFDKYSNALKYYKLLGDKPKQQNCLFNMAGCVGITGRGTAEDYFKEAIELAVELNDSSSIVNCYELWSRQLSMEDSTRSEAKRIALKCLNNYPKFMNLDLIIDLAFIYVMDDMIDSARYYLNIAERYPANDHMGQIQTRKNSILAIIAKRQKYPAQNDYYSSESQRVADSIVNNQHRYMIQHIENVNNEIQGNAVKHRISNLQWMVTVLAIVFLAALLMLAVFHHIKMARTKAIMKEIKPTSFNTHDDLLDKLEAKESAIGELVYNLVKFMQTSIDASEKDSPSVIRRRIKETIGDIANDEFWKALRNHLDKNYHNMIANLAQNPQLKEKDLRFIELMCCGFSYVEIAITLDYTPNYVSQKRDIIAKKLDLSVPLQEYLDCLMNHND
jgi:hypothetical protein